MALTIVGIGIFWGMLVGGHHMDDIDARWGRGSVVDEWQLEREQTKRGWVDPLKPHTPTANPGGRTLVDNPKKTFDHPDH